MEELAMIFSDQAENGLMSTPNGPTEAYPALHPRHRQRHL